MFEVMTPIVVILLMLAANALYVSGEFATAGALGLCLSQPADVIDEGDAEKPSCPSIDANATSAR